MNRESILKVTGSRTHRVTGSLGVYDVYKGLRKRKWVDIGQRLTEHEFYSIIRGINNLLAEELAKGKEIKLPHRMGILEIRKTDTYIKFIDGKLVTNLAIDWDRTLKLWCEDEEAYENKTLIKMEEKELFKIYYNKSKAVFNNKIFYQFNPNRELKKALKENIKNGEIDAFLFTKY